jgi:hypothetical protein
MAVGINGASAAKEKDGCTPVSAVSAPSYDVRSMEAACMGSPSPLAADPYGRVSFVASRIVFSSGIGHKGVQPPQISAVKARMGQIYRSVEDRDTHPIVTEGLGVQEGQSRH